MNFKLKMLKIKIPFRIDLKATNFEDAHSCPQTNRYVKNKIVLKRTFNCN